VTEFHKTVVSDSPLSEPYQPHSIPPIGEAHAVTGGPKFSPVTTESSREKLRSPKLKYEALEICEVSRPFERKVLMHYSYVGPLSKQGIYTVKLVSGAPLKAN